MGQAAAFIAAVKGPDGTPLTFADLPPRGNTRWVIRRKAEVVAAVRGGLLTLEEACERYRLTIEEYSGWQHALDAYGTLGLRITRARHYRDAR
jgi:uncharacterized protein DUF1153